MEICFSICKTDIVISCSQACSMILWFLPDHFGQNYSLGHTLYLGYGFAFIKLLRLFEPKTFKWHTVLVSPFLFLIITVYFQSIISLYFNTSFPLWLLDSSVSNCEEKDPVATGIGFYQKCGNITFVWLSFFLFSKKWMLRGLWKECLEAVVFGFSA